MKDMAAGIEPAMFVVRNILAHVTPCGNRIKHAVNVNFISIEMQQLHTKSLVQPTNHFAQQTEGSNLSRDQRTTAYLKSN